jgi:protein TonB
MLEDSLFESQSAGKTRKPFTMVLAAIVHVVTIGALIVIPLLQTQALPLALVNNMLLRLPSVSAPKPIDAFAARPHAQKPVPSAPEALTTPQAIPDRIPIIDEAPPVPLAGFLPFADGRGEAGIVLPNVGLPGGALTMGSPVKPVAPPLPPPPVSTKINVFRTGGQVEPPKLIHRVDPVYPAPARQARVQGVVVMDAAIRTNGSVDRLHVTSGNLLLNQAALDAVKQWKYTPARLNGEPVEVTTTITVTFSFNM